MAMKNLFPTRFAEILYALVMIAFGGLHLKYGSAATGVPSYFPGDDSVWMYVTGIAFLAAGIAIIINKFRKLACYLLALMLIIFILTVHLDDVLHFKNLYQPLKDGALAMAAIIIGNNASK
jgi:putative oxidoreductase